MKIGIDCRLWDETGVGRYIRNLVLNLQKFDKKNQYVLFVLNKDEDGILKQVQNDNFRIIEADIRWHTIEEQLKLPQILNRENLELVHFPYFSVPIFYNRPYVVTIHDLIINHFPTGKASTLPSPIYNLKLLGYRFVIAQAAKKAKKIITVSNATKKEILDHLGIDSSKVVVTYEGVYESSKLKAQSSKIQLKTQKYFLYVGNAYPHKNLERLIGAFNAFCHPERRNAPDGASRSEGSKDSSPDSHRGQNDMLLILVGREDYFYKRLKIKVKKMKLADKVIFLQNVKDSELSSLYKNAIALVVPSLMEGFSLPALEAMANNCLVLASDIPSLIETCGNAALYFNPLNVNDLTDKLNMVSLHTTEYGGLEELRERGVERARKFSWRKMAKETLAVYQELASNL